MYLSCTTRSPEDEIVNHSLLLTEMEVAMEVLNMLVLEGHVLIDASLTEEGDRLSLPVAAFDGQLIGNHVHALKQEWNRLLNL